MGAERALQAGRRAERSGVGGGVVGSGGRARRGWGVGWPGVGDGLAGSGGWVGRQWAMAWPGVGGRASERNMGSSSTSGTELTLLLTNKLNAA